MPFDKRLFRHVRMTDISAVACPCGSARRAFGDVPDAPASFHQVEISDHARLHYHKHTTEIYYVLSGEGFLELDDERVPIATGEAVMIQPGCRHRAIGRMTILNVVIPAFDPHDEWFD